MTRSGEFACGAICASLLLPASALGAGFRAITLEEAASGVSVCVTGVVTMASSWQPNSCVIASPDDPNGPAVYVGGTGKFSPGVKLENLDAPLSVGQVVEVRGRAAPMLFEPGVEASSIVAVGAMKLPSPPEYTLRDFANGRLDNRRAALSGVLMDVVDGKFAEHETDAKRFARLRIATGEGVFNAHVLGDSSAWREMVDAEVRVEGCAMSYFNLRAEFLGLQLEVMSPNDVNVAVPPPHEPFDSPEVPLDRLFTRGDNHRVRVRGVVTYAKGGEFFYIQSGMKTLKVRSRSLDPIAPGDEIEAAGFPLMRDNMGVLDASVYRKAGHRDPIAPLQEYSDEDRMPFVDWKVLDLGGMARTIVAQWVRGAHTENEDAAYVFLRESMVKVVAPKGMLDVPPDWDEWHPTVRVTGVCATKMEENDFEGRHTRITSFDMLIDDTPGRGVELVKDGVWRLHTRKVAAARVVLAASIFAFLGMVVMFVRWRAQRLRSLRRKAIDAERKRMAGDLHDTIEQHISGARMLLNGVRIYGGTLPCKVVGALKDADEILARAKVQIREAVWNLRSDELFDSPPDVVLRRIAKRVSTTGAVRVETFLATMPGGLDAHKFAECVYVVQEAITNAVKHGKARRVAICSDENGIYVLNDGQPFEADKVLGAEAGHFGLSSMRERAARIGMSLTFENRKRFVAVKMEVKK